MNKNDFNWNGNIGLLLMCVTFILMLLDSKIIFSGQAGASVSALYVAALLCLTLAIALKILELKKLADLRHASESDVTGINNKKVFENKMEQLARYPSCLGLGIISFDLNNLKVVNDTLGHAAGDRMISAFADILAHTLRDHFVARTGGDEFVAIVEDTSEEELEKLLNKLNDAVKKYNEFRPVEKISYAGGFACCTEDSYMIPEELLKLSDKRMYENKIIMKGSKR